MNLSRIFSAIESIDPEVYERTVNRRSLFSNVTSLGAKAAATGALLLGTTLKKSYGKGKASVGDVLNYALTLEYLEDAFYKQGLMSEGLIPTDRRVIFQQISKHESAHVEFLLGVLDTMDVQPVAKPEFDFTANGTYGNVWSNYNTFLTLSQAFEDTGVRAYKGRAQELVGQAALTAALQIHSVEARHASMIRRLRGEKGWITNAETNGVPAAIYAGEDLTTQGGASITGLGFTAAAATQAFDEPLTPDQVLAIADPFIVKS
jgi:hypothetical protein